MARVRFKARFFVLLIVLIALLGLVIYLIFGAGGSETLSAGTMRISQDVTSVIIRDEVLRTTEKYDRILFDVAEGAEVAMGDQIAQVFRWGYQDATMQALLDVRKEILAHQTALLAGIVNADLDTVNTQINLSMTNIRSTARQDIDQAGINPNTNDLLVLEQQLKEQLESRMDLMRQVQADETLQALYVQEEEQLANLASWRRDIVNDVGDGIVSFYFDGYELALNAEKLDVISADLVESTLRGTGGDVSLEDAAVSALYRIVDADHFYIAFLTDSDDPWRLMQGLTYTVSFEGYEEQAFSATALEPIVSGSDVVNVLEFNQDMGTLMSVRTVEGTVMLDASGFEVESSAVTVIEGQPGIYIDNGSADVFVPVHVLATDESTTIVASVSPDALSAGMRYKS